VTKRTVVYAHNELNSICAHNFNADTRLVIAILMLRLISQPRDPGIRYL